MPEYIMVCPKIILYADDVVIFIFQKEDYGCYLKNSLDSDGK